MVSPISALTSSSPGVRALSRVSAVTAKATPDESPATTAATAAAPPPAALGPGQREALPAGYRNLNIPVGAEARVQLAASAASGDAVLTAAYGPNAAILAELPRLVGDRLPVRTIARETQAAARARAEALGETLTEFLDAAPTIAQARRPSRNSADAEATLRLSLLARDGAHETATIDVYLTKTGPGVFEAVAFDRDYAALSGGFPYSAAPLSIDRLLLDPANAAIVAAAGGLRPTASIGATSRFGVSLVAALAAATLLGVALVLAADHPAAALALGGLGLGAVAFALLRRS